MNAEKQQEHLRRYCALFGLRYEYTAEELGAAYRALARLNHPDVSNDPAAPMRMVIINEARSWLELRLKEPPQRNIAETGPDQNDAWQLYRAAFARMSSALADYYGDGDKAAQADLALLRQRLSAAREMFARVVNELPYSQWVDDAIDRIFSINRWLED